MANALGTLSMAVIATRALELAVAMRPEVKAITTDFSAETMDLDQEVKIRTYTVPPVTPFGDAPSDAIVGEKSVKLTDWEKVHHLFTADEIQKMSKDATKIDEIVAPWAEAIANHLAANTLSLITAAAFPSPAKATTVAADLSDLGYGTFTKMRRALNAPERGAPKAGRFALVNGDLYEVLLNDETLINQSKNPGQNTIQSGRIVGVAGFEEIIETDLLPASAAGFAGHKNWALLAVRPPKDPRMGAADIPAPMSIDYVTEPNTGFTVAVNRWIDTGYNHNFRIHWLRGGGLGETKFGQRLIRASGG